MSNLHSSYVFFLTYRTREWVGVLKSLVKDLSLDEEMIRVIDVSLFTSPRQISLTSTQLTKLLELPLEILKPQQAELGGYLPPLADIEKASYGQMQTYFQDDQPRSSFLLRRQLQRSTNLALDLYGQVRALSQWRRYKIAYVPNGRFPQEVAIASALGETGVEVKFFEKSGTNPGAYFTSKTRVHDSSLDEEDGIVLSSSELGLLQKNLLSEKRALPTISTCRRSNPIEKNFVLFLSSSTDEVGAYSWLDTSSKWVDQYEAFHSISSYFAAIGIESILRVHPNLQNKSVGMRRREVKRLRFLEKSLPKLRVIYDWEPQNTHSLIRESSYVVTSLSTTGLDASALGKCVWITMNNSWSRFADVREIFSPRDLNAPNLSKWEVDAGRAMRRILALRMRDRNVLRVPPSSGITKVSERLIWISFMNWSERLLLVQAKIPLALARATRGMLKAIRLVARKLHQQPEAIDCD